MDAMYEYIVRRGGRITDRELARELGMSLGSVNRRKRALMSSGVIKYGVISRRGGTEYYVEQKAEQSGTKAEDTSRVLYLSEKRERRAREAAEQSGSEVERVLGAWAKYRGRVLIEDEVAEMSGWIEKLGASRVIELIGLAWRRCTADRMSMGYFADYFIEPELSGTKRVEQKPEQKKVRKHEPTAAPLKVTAAAKIKKEPPKIKRTGTEPWLKYLREEKKNDGQGNMPSMSGDAVPEGGQSRAERNNDPRTRARICDV